MSSPSCRVNDLQYAALAFPTPPPGPNNGPLQFRLSSGGGGGMPEPWCRVTSWAASAQPWKSSGEWLAARTTSFLPSWESLLGLGAVMTPAPEDWHCRHMHETQAAAGIYPLSHSTGVFVQGREVLPECIRALSVLSLGFRVVMPVSSWWNIK